MFRKHGRRKRNVFLPLPGAEQEQCASSLWQENFLLGYLLETKYLFARKTKKSCVIAVRSRAQKRIFKYFLEIWYMLSPNFFVCTALHESDYKYFLSFFTVNHTQKNFPYAQNHATLPFNFSSYTTTQKTNKDQEGIIELPLPMKGTFISIPPNNPPCHIRNMFFILPQSLAEGGGGGGI